jgi:regulatory protein
LGAELRRRHIDEGLIDVALSQIDDDEEQLSANELARKRAQRLRGLDRRTALRRLAGYLARKGYEQDTVRVAVQSALPDRAPGGSHSVRFQ